MKKASIIAAALPSVAFAENYIRCGADCIDINKETTTSLSGDVASTLSPSAPYISISGRGSAIIWSAGTKSGSKTTKQRCKNGAKESYVGGFNTAVSGASASGNGSVSYPLGPVTVTGTVNFSLAAVSFDEWSGDETYVTNSTDKKDGEASVTASVSVNAGNYIIRAGASAEASVKWKFVATCTKEVAHGSVSYGGAEIKEYSATAQAYVNSGLLGAYQNWSCTIDKDGNITTRKDGKIVSP